MTTGYNIGWDRRQYQALVLWKQTKKENVYPQGKLLWDAESQYFEAECKFF